MSERPREPVTDTPPDVQALFVRLLMERSGEERVRMACDMFQAARRLILAGLSEAVASDPVGRQVALLERTYPDELDEPLLRRVVAELRSRRTPDPGYP